MIVILISPAENKSSHSEHCSKLSLCQGSCGYCCHDYTRLQCHYLRTFVTSSVNFTIAITVVITVLLLLLLIVLIRTFIRSSSRFSDATLLTCCKTVFSVGIHKLCKDVLAISSPCPEGKCRIQKSLPLPPFQASTWPKVVFKKRLFQELNQ